MDSISKTFSYSFFSKPYKQGFTLIELMVAIAVAAIVYAIALPSLTTFIVKARVDNEISEMQRLLLTARNMAINTGKNTTVCPLSGGVCTTNWENKISVFTNSDNLIASNNTFAAPDELVKVKDAIQAGDRLQFSQTSIIYAPTGRIITTPANFNYCPKDEADSSRGINVSASGRSYTSSDNDKDGKDENRTGGSIVCI